MSAPSFTSFPKSFSSFPDFEEGSSSLPNSRQSRDSESRKNREYESERHGHSKKRSRSRERTDRKKDKRKRERHGTDDDKKRRHRDRAHNERSEEGHRSQTGQTRVDSSDLMYREDGSILFVFDRKGDPLNVTYGGLHSGDIPRYRFFAGKHLLLLTCLWPLSVVLRWSKCAWTGPS